MPLRATLLRGSSSSSFIVLVSRSTVARETGGRRLEAKPTSTQAQAPSTQIVDLRRQLDVGLRKAVLRVSRERQAHLVPAMQQDVRVVVRRLRQLPHTLHESKRIREVRKLPIARQRPFPIQPPPVQARQSAIDLHGTQQRHASRLPAPTRPLSPNTTAPLPTTSPASSPHTRSLPLESPMRMRIVSLVPHATELLFALGLGPDIVGVTHECDYPLEALARERITRDVLPSGLSAGEIDAAVRENTLQGAAIYELDRPALERLQPDLIVTQALCPVCAVSYDEVAEIAGQIS